MAHTSPVFVQVQGRPPRVDPDTVKVLLWELDQNLKRTLHEGGFQTARQRELLTSIFTSASNVLAKRLEA